MPVVQSPGGDVLHVTSDVASLTLDGLVLTGGNVNVGGASPLVSLRFCSLDPQSSGISYSPSVAGAKLNLTNVISGPLVASANVDAVVLNDCALQNTANGAALTVAHAASLEYVTVVGNASAGTFSVSNSILFGNVSIGDAANSCFRYSRYAQGTKVARSFRCSTAFPIFVSLQFGHPAYLFLGANTSAELRSSGENGGEMGVWYGASIPLREQNVLLKLGEYLPAGLTAVPMRALPRTPFVEVRRI